jgi:hypothetical protein
MSAIIADNGLFMERTGNSAYLTTEDGSLAWTRGGTVLDEWGNYIYAHIAVATLDVPNVTVRTVSPQVGTGVSPASQRITAQTVQPTVGIGTTQTRVPDVAAAVVPPQIAAGITQPTVPTVTATVLMPVVSVWYPTYPPHHDVTLTGMTTIIEPITLAQGEGTTINATVDTPAGAVDSSIANYTYTWRLWHILTGTVLEKTVGAGITIGVPSSAGKLAIKIDPADTLLLPPLTYEQQLCQATIAGVEKIMFGLIQVDASRPGVPSP